MLHPADPGDGALQAHAKATMGDAAVFAQVDIPGVRLARQVMLLYALLDEFRVAHALAAADDLAIAFGGEKVGAFAHLGPVGIRLHVEGLYRGGEAGNKHRFVV